MNKEDILIQSECIIRRMKNDDEEKKRLRYEISNIVEQIEKCKDKKEKEMKIENVRIKKLKNKVKENNLIITKADKGNTIVIMDKNEYIRKTEEFIKLGPYKEINYNYTNKFQAKIKRVIKENSELNNYEKKNIIESNPSIPILKCQIKLHKENKPVRPIVSFIGAPSYKLSKMMSKTLKEKYEFKEIHSIKNSKELIEKLKNVDINKNTILVTIDVKDMYTNISIRRVIELIKSNRMKEYQYKGQLIKNIEVCMEQNYFRFNNKYYIQTRGLPMGSSLSPIMAEIYMNNFEEQVIQKSEYKNKIKKWIRYVDDVLIIWEGDMAEIKEFIEELNKIEEGIQFKEEIGIEEISYLDLKINIKENRKLEYDIFRKKTHTDLIIPNESYHPINYKMSAINAMCERAISCLENGETLKKEIKMIKQIIRNNNYKESIVDKIIKRIKNKKQHEDKNKKEEEEEYLGALTYIGWNTQKIKKCFDKYGVKMAIKRSRTVFDLINNKNTEDIPITQKSGVYKIECEDCNMVYIGESGRAVECRMKEHSKGRNVNTTNSLYARHFNETKHKFTDPTENCKIIKIENKVEERKLKEELEILKQRKKDKSKLMNIKINFENEEIFYHILKKH